MVEIPNFSNITATKPQTIIKLYRGVSWDNRYTHVRLFNSKEHLVNQLEIYYHYRTLENCAPVTLGSMAIEVPYNELISANCNYLAFKNLPYDDEWHFAFIKSVDATSVNSSKINFELDVWQNSIYDATIKPSMVERAHVSVAEDTVGANTYPENFEIGGYYKSNKYIDQVPPMDENEFKIYIATTRAEDGTFIGGGLSNGVYNGATFVTCDTPAIANSYINSLTEFDGAESIIDVFQAPVSMSIENDTHFFTIDKKVSGKIDGYTPKNKKLYTYPYNYIYATNNIGGENEYRFEWFNTDKCVFTWILPASTNPTLIVYPNNYKGIVDNNIEGLTFNNYPKCAIAIDSYKAWLAQSGAGRAVEAFTNVLGMDENTALGLGTVLNGIMNRGFSTITDPLGTAMNLLTSSTRAYVQSPKTKGSAGNSLYHAINKDHIDFYYMQISKEYAEKIDSFWSQFGYPHNKIMDINLKKRKYWNYIKTVDIALCGNIDLDMLSKLREIFNRGVTIWHTNDVGNYNLDNNKE